MIDLQGYLEKKILDIIFTWQEENIYALSFFVYANESFAYRGYRNLPEFSVSYNTEFDCKGADRISEQRWLYAFWRQEEFPVIDLDTARDGMDLLLDWYKERGLVDIGYEDTENCYDEQMRYIGRGPVGYYELLVEITAVAKKLQESGFIQNKFGTKIPIIIHDLEYPWYIMEANKIANSQGQADSFFATMKKIGIMQ